VLDLAKVTPVSHYSAVKTGICVESLPVKMKHFGFFDMEKQLDELNTETTVKAPYF